MSHAIVIGFPDSAQSAAVAEMLTETDDLAVATTGGDAATVRAALAQGSPAAAILHEDLGPIPVMDLARELAVSHPDVGLVLAMRDPGAPNLRAALQAGVRDVVGLPIAFEDLATSLRGASEWGASMRRIGDPEEGDVRPSTSGGHTIVLAGAKGGVGVSVAAVQLAMAALRHDRERSVCLVDLDLQAGDLRTLLDLPYRRGISDLVPVATELSARHLEETLYVHPSGLRVLLAPDEGEHAEDVTTAVARNVLAAVRLRSHLVIVDAGSNMTEASTVAVEIADQVAVLATPDVLSLRAANRLIELWRRLHLREGDVRVVLTRAARRDEIQADMAEKVLAVPRTKTTLPAEFRELEAAVNTGEPDRLTAGGLRDAYVELARELGAIDEPAPRRGLARLRESDSGQVAVDAMGIIGIMLVVLAAGWQAVLIGYTYVLSGHSAREGARALAVGDDVSRHSREDLPSTWRSGAQVEHRGSRVTVTLKVPIVVPGVDGPISVGSSAATVMEEPHP